MTPAHVSFKQVLITFEWLEAFHENYGGQLTAGDFRDGQFPYADDFNICADCHGLTLNSIKEQSQT